ncbi:SDR family oxidoreductase [Ruegeria pomeroyi]|uniref:SDR family oxidoreductase n=1 Tax=Ruegeria pomeroyi TaxID=89184 RepID=UPI001F25A8A7|nr:SDR family oxidoreductase [Ruegeria pomeroyi]MCE8510955.1 SDR family oxidoreductase [Ruegeria pomeroyi]
MNPKKTWLVTGTSSGFGRQLAEQILARGDNLVATTRRDGALDDLAARFAPQLHVVHLDVTDTPAIRATVQEALARFGRIDVCVSNAGYGLFGAAEELSDEQIRRQIDTNVIGSIQLIRAVLPAMRAQRGGRIIQLSSMGGQIAFPNLSLYHATKWAVEGFCEALAQEVACFGIGVTLAEPGGAKTEFGGRNADAAPPLEAYADTPAGQIRAKAMAGEWPNPGDPAKIAAAIIATTELDTAPLRLVLGSDSHALMSQTLDARLKDIRAQQASAAAADV